jgi:hypothetical protein
MIVWFSILTLMSDTVQIVDIRLCQIATGNAA